MLQHLPGELFDVILSYIPESDLGKTILSLTRVFPYHGISTRALFRDVCLRRPEQVAQFYRRLRGQGQGQEQDQDQEDRTPTWVQTFTLEAWTADAEIVLNIVQLLPNLTRLTLWIGPTNFSPEHLEEMFNVKFTEAPKSGKLRIGIGSESRCLACLGKLEYLSLRFRPYVQQASYSQFLKGAYFDSALEAISRWPRTSLPRLSIIQDPLTPESSTSAGSEVTLALPKTFSSGLPKRTLESGFAQPIVFFRLDTTVPELLRSESIHLTLTSLRVRLPARMLHRALTQPPPPNPPSFGAPVKPGSDAKAFESRYRVPPRNSHLPPSPYLTFLDLSTSSISESSIPLILSRYPCLTHLIADDCGLFHSGDMATRDGGREWSKLARDCVMAGGQKAKEREKKIKDWLEDERIAYERTRKSPDGQGDPQAVKKGKKPRGGRKGLATASISLRKGNIAATFASGSRPRADPELFGQKIRILPPPPTLCAFTTSLILHTRTGTTTDPGTAEADPPDDLISSIQNEWERGWSEGVTLLVRIRERLRASWRNGLIRVMRFATVDEIRNGIGVVSSSTKNRPQTPEDDSSTSKSPARSISSSSSSLSSQLSRDDELNLIDVGEGGLGLGGLVDVVDEREFDVNLIGTACASAPVLCLAGASELYSPCNISEESSTGTSTPHGPGFRPGDNLRVVRPHAEGCAHELGRKIWLDNW